MTARQTKTTTIIRWGAVLGLALLTGCKSHSGAIVIPTEENARLTEARRLAADAQREAKAGHNDKAIELYQKSLDQSRDLFFVWNNLGLLLMEQENYTDAAEMFKSAADLAPEDPRPFYNIGLIYQRAVYDEKAREYFVKSLERDPKYLPALRGAIISDKRLDISDDPSLTRVRTALLIETDPQWRKIFMTEQLRIEGTMSRAKRGIGALPNRAQDAMPAVQTPETVQVPTPDATKPRVNPSSPPAEPQPTPAPNEPDEPKPTAPPTEPMPPPSEPGTAPKVV
jgi:tetratricopeptide (TPR) repeat protein